VLTGGSYSGALAAWTESTSPGTFWAYHAASAPVEAIYDYVSDLTSFPYYSDQQWRYFVPVQEGMPTNCSRDINRVMEYVDYVRFAGSKRRQWHLKKMFGLEELQHFDDFAG
jgi:hypothetical protein